MGRTYGQQLARRDRFVSKHIRPPMDQPEKLYHSECGSLVKKEWWFTKNRVAICISCDERVEERNLLTYEEWKEVSHETV